jgi:hypothetical protein
LQMKLPLQLQLHEFPRSVDYGRLMLDLTPLKSTLPRIFAHFASRSLQTSSTLPESTLPRICTQNLLESTLPKKDVGGACSGSSPTSAIPKLARLRPNPTAGLSGFGLRGGGLQARLPAGRPACRQAGLHPSLVETRWKHEGYTGESAERWFTRGPARSTIPPRFTAHRVALHQEG